MAECSSCGRSIVWCETHKGARMPVDRRPHEKGNLIVLMRSGQPPLALPRNVAGPLVVAKSWPEIREKIEAGALYKSHFATCPHADRHRKGK